MIIYCIINLINNKRYIGQTKNKLNQRYNSDFTKKPANDHLKFAYQRYGKENFKIEIIRYCLSINALNYWEKYYINLYNTVNPIYGYNKEFGGNDQILTEETKRKASVYWKNRYKKDKKLQQLLKENNEKNHCF